MHRECVGRRRVRRVDSGKICVINEIRRMGKRDRSESQWALEIEASRGVVDEKAVVVNFAAPADCRVDVWVEHYGL